MLYVPEFKNMIGRNAEIIILTESDEQLSSGLVQAGKSGSAKGMTGVADDLRLPLDDMPHLTDLSRHEGVISLNEKPEDFQRRMRDEWT
jgi:hypothetical protein